MEQKIHQGQNVKRFREILGIEQEALASDLGEDWEQKISLLEQKETIENPLLQKISEAMKIPVEAFQNFDDKQAVNVISNTFIGGAYIGNSGCTYNINPLVEIIKIHEEKISLYERMLKEKDEMMTRLDALVKNG